MPYEASAEAAVGIVYAVFELADCGLQSRAAFEIQALDQDVAGSLLVPEEQIGRGCHDTTVVLCHDVGDNRQVGGIVEGDAVLAVVDIEIVGDHMLPEHESVLKALYGDIAQDIVIVLVARHHQSHRVAGIFTELLFEHRVSDILIQAELTVTDRNAGDVLKIRTALGRVHLVLVQMDAQLQICHRELRHAEVSLTAVTLGCGDDCPRPFGGIVDLGCLPIRKNAGIIGGKRSEGCRGEMILYRGQGANHVGIQHLTRHFAQKENVRVVFGRDHKLCAHLAPVVFLNSGGRETIAAPRIGEADAPAAPFCGIIDCRLNCRGVIGDSVALCAEVHNIDSECSHLCGAPLLLF